MALILKLLALALLISSNIFSQEHKIVGRILDLGTQKPIKNANIIIIGTTSGTISNHLGFFELTIDTSQHKILIVSHIGFKTAEVRIPADGRFKFSLEKEYILLNQLNLNLYPKALTDGLEVKGNKTEDNSDLIIVESGASFPSGMINFYNLMGNALSSELNQVGEKGFNIAFTINESGRAVGIFTSDSTESIRNAAIKVFDKMPDWTSATQRQNKVSQHFILPIVRLTIPDIKSLDLSEYYDFMSRNIQYPAQARRMGVEGVVYAEFQIDNSGNLTSIKILKDIGADCGTEVKRIIKAVPTKLTSSLLAKTNSVKFILPVCFGLGVPFKSPRYSSPSDAFLLDALPVTAVGIEREKRVVGNPYWASLTPAVTIGPAIITYDNLDKALAEPKAVKRLSLVNNNLNSIPPDMLKLTNLEFLDLEKNHLQTLPNEINAFSKLQELFLFENQIQSLPENFGKLNKLKILALGSNQLKSFPHVITSLDKLETLDLGKNQLSSIPSEIGLLKNLKVLMLQGNAITNIPQELYGLKKLETIILQGNPINAKDIELLKATFQKAEIRF